MDAIEEELDLLEAELLFESDPGRQMRLATFIESRRIELAAIEATP